jgi:hypothetical protein
LAKNDWIVILDIFYKTNSSYLENFISSPDIFCPSSKHVNIFNSDKDVFSAKQLDKQKPGSWIPIYKQEDLSAYLLDNNLMPVRCGQAEFFFYKGKIIYDLKDIHSKKVSLDEFESIEKFVPLTLENFHKNENAFLNKALAVGIINHFIDNKKELHLFKKTIQNKNYRRLLYGQFGKIKTNFEMEFKTTKGSKTINKGFQFEIDLVLENKDEIIIFEAKQGSKWRDSFSLLQLYYPLVYLAKITKKQKTIRTIFIDIITKDSQSYKLTEFVFVNYNFDDVEIVKSLEY